MTKMIAITDELYNKLKTAKGTLSFSAYIDTLATKNHNQEINYNTIKNACSDAIADARV